ncbi:MAG: TetR/AcrR family transcriptional regulator, partial [Flavobacteriaceae bacterium]|nr:TetR/AcrR family transcriptional regulator [Flavobacteriaceae bacterium]
MPSKAEKTTAYIIETVAPIFTKHGYVGTSMSALTEATGLTKGALYGNFTNKEDLALRAFDFSSNKLIEALEKPLNSDG